MMVSGEAYMMEPKMTQRMPTIMERFSWVWAPTSTPATTAAMNTAWMASTPSIFHCTHSTGTWHGLGACRRIFCTETNAEKRQ